MRTFVFTVTTPSAAAIARAGYPRGCASPGHRVATGTILDGNFGKDPSSVILASESGGPS